MIRLQTRQQGSGSMGLGDRIFVSLVFLVFLGAGSFFLYATLQSVGHSLKTHFWPPVPCEILESDVQQTNSSNDPYVFTVRYRYTFNGKTYESTQYARTKPQFSDYTEARRLVYRFNAGQHDRCFVNPDNPAEVVLKQDSAWGILGVPFSLVFVLIGGGGIYLVWRQTGSVDPAVQPISAKANKNTGCGLLFGALFFLLGVGMFGGLFVPPMLRIYQARNWPAVPCEIITGHVQKHSGGKSSTYSVDILYEYQAKGQTYRSSRYQFMGGASSGRESKEQILAHYPSHSHATCYVNPDDPTDAVLNRGFTPDMLFGLIPLAFALFGGIAFVAVYRQRPASPTSARVRKPVHTFPEPSASGNASGGSVVMKPAQSPLAQFFAALFVAAFWNGILSVFLTQLVSGWRRGSHDWFLTVFLVPFVLIGLGMLGAVVYYFLRIFNPRPILTLNAQAIPLGGRLELHWRIHGRTAAIRRLQLILRGQEETTRREGKSTASSEETFLELKLADLTDATAMAEGRAVVEIPAASMHTFTAPNNKIVWTIEVDGDIARWPDIDEEFPLTVLPATLKPPPRA